MIKKILISQPKPASDKSPYFDLAKTYGVEFVFHPFIRVESVSTKEFRTQKVQILDHTAIVFNSRHAIDHFFNLCNELRVAIPDDMKYFGLSEKIMLYIQKYVQYRKRKIFFGATGKWEDLVQIMAKHKTEKYLLPQSDVAGDEVSAMLEAKKLQHTECTMYRTVPNDMPQTLEGYDMVIPFTPSGAIAIADAYPSLKDGKVLVGCFGKNTAQTLKDAGIPVAMEAPSVQAPSMTGTLELFLKETNQ